MTKLEEIKELTLTKTVFATLAVTALIGTALVFPSLGYIIMHFAKDNNHKYYVKRIFRKLEKQKLISISENNKGEITITLTESGKQKALTYQIETMKLHKPKTWDGKWRIVIFDIPETKKQSREIFRKNLMQLGFYPLQKSVFITPYKCRDQIDFLKHNFNIENDITYAEANFIDNQNFLRNHFQV